MFNALYCVYRPLLCSTPSIVFIARFCVQRPLLCLSPAFVFNALYCVYRPLLCSTPSIVFIARFCVQRPHGGSMRNTLLVDYCNKVLAGLPQTQINRLQSILRATARLVLQLPGWASVSNLMRVQLHWLSIPQRSQFKLCSIREILMLYPDLYGSMVYRCLHNTAPIYLRDLCVPISSLEGRSHLRSATAGDFRIPSAKTVTIGRSGFSVFCCRSCGL